MAWISVHEQLKDHRKVRHLAKLLNCTRHEALGILVTLWLWGINNTDRSGDLNGADADDIADGIMYRAQPAEALVRALVDSKWLDETNGHYILHDWDIWQDWWYKAIDRREANKQRMRTARNNDCATHSDAHSATNSSEHVDASPSPNRHLTVTNNVIIENDAPPASKTSVAEYVTMTEAEHEKLITKYGEQDAARLIEILDNYKGQSGTRYKSDYRAILNWCVKRLEEEKRKVGPPHEMGVLNVVNDD